MGGRGGPSQNDEIQRAMALDLGGIPMVEPPANDNLTTVLSITTKTPTTNKELASFHNQRFHCTLPQQRDLILRLPFKDLEEEGSASRGYLIGPDANICDICLTDPESKDVSFFIRVVKDENGVNNSNSIIQLIDVVPGRHLTVSYMSDDLYEGPDLWIKPGSKFTRTAPFIWTIPDLYYVRFTYGPQTFILRKEKVAPHRVPTATGPANRRSLSRIIPEIPAFGLGTQEQAILLDGGAPLSEGSEGLVRKGKCLSTWRTLVVKTPKPHNIHFELEKNHQSLLKGIVSHAFTTRVQGS